MRGGGVSGILACLLDLCACAPSIENGSIGRFEASGFYNRVLPYRVAYDDPRAQRVVGDGFHLDNFWSVKLSRSRSRLEAKREDSARFEAVLLDDGERLIERRVPKQDLIFVRPATRSSIWLSSVPLRSELASATLFEVAGQHAQGLEARGFPTVGLGSGGLAPSHRVRVLGQRDVRVDGLKAFETTLELSPNDGGSGASGETLVRTIVVRPPFEWPIGARRYPTLLILGYAGPEAHFAAGLPAFERFVNRVELDFDGALRAKSQAALACTQPPSDEAEVLLDVDAKGEITRISPDTPWRGDYDPRAYESEEVIAARRKRVERARACLGDALRGVRLAATGDARDVRFMFERGMRVVARVDEPYRAGAWPPPAQPSEVTASEAAPTDAPPSSAPAPAAPPPVPVPVRDAEPESDAVLRAELQRHAPKLLACVGEQVAAVQVDYDAGVALVQLRDPLHGSPEEACVRQVLHQLEPPPGRGRVIHVLSREQLP